MMTFVLLLNSESNLMVRDLVFCEKFFHEISYLNSTSNARNAGKNSQNSQTLNHNYTFKIYNKVFVRLFSYLWKLIAVL